MTTKLHRALPVLSSNLIIVPLYALNITSQIMLVPASLALILILSALAVIMITVLLAPQDLALIKVFQNNV